MSSHDKPVYHFVFLRHGESIGNAQARWQGQSDYPLTEKGRAQAQALAERWKAEGAKFDLIIASPLGRAKETAEIIAPAVGAPVEFDPILLERHIVPLFYDRNDDGVPVGFVQKMKHALRVSGSFFTARRMLQEYVTRYYAPAVRGDATVDDPPTA